MKTARLPAEPLPGRDPEGYDAWLAVGVENYMLSLKPAPVRFFLRLAGGETERAKGIQKLKLASEKGRYLAPFARLMLAVAAMRHVDKGTARGILASLTTE